MALNPFINKYRLSVNKISELSESPAKPKIQHSLTTKAVFDPTNIIDDQKLMTIAQSSESEVEPVKPDEN